MKMFWKVLGMENDFYTGKACYQIVDRKNGISYEIGEGQLFLKKDYPKNIIENISDFFEGKLRYGIYYKFSDQPDRVEKKGFFGKSRLIYTKVHPQQLETEYIGLFGLWEIEGLDVYTDIGADYIRDKTTGKEYKRGERKLFRDEDMTPFPLAEHTDKYEFIFEREPTAPTNDLQEIRSILTVNSIFNKK
jgi:hypothetical protein